MDIVLDLWISAIYKDDRVQGSEVGPVAYFRNGTGSPLITYAELAQRWGLSKATVCRVLSRLKEQGYITFFSFPGKRGTAIYLQYYLSVMFRICDVKMDKAEVAMSLRIELHVDDDDCGARASQPEKRLKRAARSVSAGSLSVSERVKSAMAEKVLESLVAQGFSCSNCPKFHYKLYSLSPDCKGAKERARLWKTSAHYQMELFCSTGEPTYGTAGFMSKKEMTGVADMVSDVRRHHGIILGELDGKVLCLPEKTRFNGNLAVYGASGSKKTRSFCMNMILQCASRTPMTSLIICDPKSELYEKSSEYLRDKGYVVRKFDLVTPGSSDSWNCLAEIGGQELMAQLFCDVIIKNTGSGKGDHFWDNAEMNLLKALVLYVEQSYPPEKRNIGEV